jgi:hypothetical protein
MSGERFTLRWIALFVLLGVLIVASPYIVELLTQNAACFGTEHACADMAGVYAHYGRSMVLVLVLIPLLVAVAARALSAGVFAWAFPFALLMVAGALPLLYAVGGPEVSTLAEAMAHPALIPIFFLLVLFLALSVESEDGVGGMWRVAMPLVALITLFLTSSAWLPGVALMPVLGPTAQPIGFYLGEAHGALGLGERIGPFVNLCLLAFVLAAAGMMMSARSRSGRA